MKYFIRAFGCQFNKADAERISQLLEKKGYKRSPIATRADLIVILMCSVRQKSVDKVKYQISNIRNTNKKAKIILTGCVLEADKEMFERMGVEIKKFADLERFTPITGLITIGQGCDNFCSYCVVPYTRGREKYRSQAAIVKETKHLIGKGIKEITLVAQNVNSYPNFTGLLQKITKLPGDFKVKFLTNHPKDFSDELIKEMAKNPKIIKYVHLPFQAGDNEILKKMNRHYTRQGYLKLISKIRKAMPEVGITTDIIVGFPGETEQQFAKTIEVVEKAGFKQAFVAKYSPRPGTAAFCLKDNVPLEEKKRREQALLNLIKNKNEKKKKNR
ncbi:MAG: MiaB/RimO family radical SAM methylthiotransferase [Candidatus Pacebacteria bacterium]|nr:MiaB/RimO family radical SAM methylthiotransferase [Candidatus Paceibacterota bacterium]